MKKLFFITAILSWASLSFAQKPYEIKNFSGNISISGAVGGLIIEGHNSKDVIIMAEPTNEKTPEKAKGLKLITPGGIDNTGLGVTVEKHLSDDEVETISINFPNQNKLYKNFKIKVPAASNLKINGDDALPPQKATLSVSSVSGELEINCTWCDINVTDFSGNIVSNTYYGETYIVFSKFETSKASYITGGNKDVDITLPNNAKTNIKMTSTFGNTYTDFNLEKTDDTQQNKAKRVIIKGKEMWPESIISIPGVEIKADTITILDYFFNPGTSENSVNKANKALISQLKNASDLMKEALKDVKVENVKAISVYNEFVKTNADYTINGGGSLLSVKSFTGNIYLRKKE